jgi:hypothetical protein
VTDRHQDQVSGDSLHLLLDTALAKYSAVEPRVGLEDRILTNLLTEQEQSPVHAWWKWGLAAIAAIAVVALAMTFRWQRPSRLIVVQRTPVETPNSTNRKTQVANREATPQPKHPAILPTRKHHASPAVALEATPALKLDQFPSPQPLTEEEKALVGYVERDPDHAALLAEARMDSLRQNAEERRQLEMKDQRTTQ